MTTETVEFVMNDTAGRKKHYEFLLSWLNRGEEEAVQKCDDLYDRFELGGEIELMEDYYIAFGRMLEIENIIEKLELVIEELK